MENLLTDLCIEAEAHTITSVYLAGIFDEAEHSSDESKRELFRIVVSVAKYYITKRQPNFTYECMEVFGGNGFVEDQPMAKLFRHSPLNSIWEGSGNVIALDVLRGHKSIPLLIHEIKRAQGMDVRLDRFVMNLEKKAQEMMKLPLSSDSQRQARLLTDRLALAFQSSLLLRLGHPQVSKHSTICACMRLVDCLDGREFCV